MTKRILIVDDDAINLKLAGDILVANNYCIFEAVNGKEGVAIAIEQNPDLILMDIQMPVMDGLSAIRILKSNDSVRNIPIIAVTASIMEGEKESALLAGADGFLSKPIKIRELLEIIEKHIIGN